MALYTAMLEVRKVTVQYRVVAKTVARVIVLVAFCWQHFELHTRLRMHI